MSGCNTLNTPTCRERDRERAGGRHHQAWDSLLLGQSTPRQRAHVILNRSACSGHAPTGHVVLFCLVLTTDPGPMLMTAFAHLLQTDNLTNTHTCASDARKGCGVWEADRVAFPPELGAKPALRARIGPRHLNHSCSVVVYEENMKRKKACRAIHRSLSCWYSEQARAGGSALHSTRAHKYAEDNWLARWRLSLRELYLAIRCDRPERGRAVRACVSNYFITALLCFALLCRAAAGRMRSLLYTCKMVADMTRLKSLDNTPRPPTTHAPAKIRRIDYWQQSMSEDHGLRGCVGLAAPPRLCLVLRRKLGLIACRRETGKTEKKGFLICQ